MKIAVASKNGFDVDLHFGRTESFLVYDITSSSVKPERRSVIPYADPRAQATQNHPFNQSRFDAVLTELDGCSKIIVKKIGKQPAEKFREAGITPIEFDGKILEIVLQIQKEEI